VVDAGDFGSRPKRGRDAGAQKSRLRTPPLFVAPSIELPRRCSALYRSWVARACGEEERLGEMRPRGTSGWMDPVPKSVWAAPVSQSCSSHRPTPSASEEGKGGLALEGEVVASSSRGLVDVKDCVGSRHCYAPL